MSIQVAHELNFQKEQGNKGRSPVMMVTPGPGGYPPQQQNMYPNQQQNMYPPQQQQVMYPPQQVPMGYPQQGHNITISITSLSHPS